MSDKTERFSYKGGCGIHKRMCIIVCKRRAGWAIDKWPQVISDIIIFKAVSYTTKKLNNKAILKLKQYCMRCYVTLSNIY